MQISCERCNTVYVLDDKLIPPGGAPVQCTRCGLVFTAKPPAGTVPSAPPPKPSAPPPSASRNPPPRSTQVFGGAAPAPVAAPAPSAHATQVFGSAPAASLAPAANPNSTMMFGGATGAPAQAPAAPVSNPNSTMMFGGAPAGPAASPPPPAPSVHSTQMFGGAQQMPPAPAPAAASRSTQVFGAASIPAPSTPAATVPRPTAPLNPNSTMMFGGTPAVAPPPAAGNTAIYGGPVPKTPPSGVPQAAPPSANSTMMFGKAPALAAPPAPTPAPNPNSTMVFGAASVGAHPADDGERAPAVEMPSVPATPGRRKPAAAPSRTAPSPEHTPTPPPEQPLPPISDPPISDSRSTDPELAPPPAEPPAQAPSWLGPAADENPDQTAPSSPRRAPARRPAAAPAPLPVAVEEAPRPQRPAAPLVGSQTMELQRSLVKRQRTLPFVIAGLAVAALFAGIGYAVLQMRVPAADPAAVAADGKALTLLKADDTESLKAALKAWEALEAQAPDFVPAKANQIIAHVFLGQDLRDEARRVASRAAVVEKEMRRLQEKKEPADWLARANALRAQLIEFKAQVDPMQEEASKHHERAGELLKASKSKVEKLGQAGDGLSLFRASALYYACQGREDEALVQIYRKSPDDRKVLHDDPRAFADLAIAGMMAHPARISSEKRDKGIEAAEAALKSDPKLLRAYLFSAKIYLANKEFEAARASVEKLLAANPAHQAAAKLKAEIEQAEAAAAKTKAKAAEAAEPKPGK